MATYDVLLVTAQEAQAEDGGGAAPNDEIAAFRKKLEELFGGNALHTALHAQNVLLIDNAGDLYDVVDRVRAAVGVGGAPSIKVACFVGHGAPGCLFLSADKWFAPRYKVESDGNKLLRQPSINGDEACRVLLGELGDYMVDAADICLIGCDFGGDTDELTPLSPGAQVAAGLWESLSVDGALRHVLFTNGRVLAVDAKDIIAGESLFSVEVTSAPKQPSKATISVVRGVMRYPTQNILPFVE